MNRILLAAALLLAAGTLQAADAPAVPKPDCRAPHAPGAAMRGDEFAMKRFKRDTKHYEDCMKSYVDEHQAIAKAHYDAANAAADEYNKTVKAINEELKE
jgi:hypothetical protein